MKEIIQPPASDEVLLDANRANYRAYFRHLLNDSGVAFHADERLTWLASGLPADFLNEVFEFDLPAEQADAAIDRLLTHYRALDVPNAWLLWPGSQPSDLGARLEQRGLGFDDDSPLMVLDFADFNPPPAQFEISRVEDEPALREWVHPVAISFGLDDERVREFYFAGHLRQGFGDDAPLQRFAIRQGGAVVATCSLSYDAGVAGIYDVTTLPEVRGQGAGSAVTAAALHYAQQRGYRYAALQSSHMGEHVYERLGFRTVGTLIVYSNRAEGEGH